jgi:alginate O-acetyltransferase complex protein AlgJ
MEAVNAPFLGVEARFAARLLTNPVIIEPHLKQTWTARHQQRPFDAHATGLEFETDTLDDPALLPPTCMFGNSFSDGMLRAGMPEHFSRFTKFSRALILPELPALAQGRCKYLVVQVLDIQAGLWLMR